MSEFWTTLAIWFLIFMFYSFAGWLIEVAVTIAEHHKVVNRGFLVGPICPIYGTGAVLISLILSEAENWLAVFCVAVVGGALLEYAVSYLMEKLFRVRWWDYSNRPFNLEGRICLFSVLAFGFAGILIIKIVTPALLAVLGALPLWLLYTLAITLFAWLIFDILLSLWLIINVRVTVGTVQKDATEEISERIHAILMEKGKLSRRLVRAFPHQTPSKKPTRRDASHKSTSRRSTSSTSPNHQKKT